MTEMRERLFHCSNCGPIPEKFVETTDLPNLVFCGNCQELQKGRWEPPRGLSDSERSKLQQMNTDDLQEKSNRVEREALESSAEEKAEKWFELKVPLCRIYGTLLPLPRDVVSPEDQFQINVQERIREDPEPPERVFTEADQRAYEKWRIVTLMEELDNDLLMQNPIGDIQGNEDELGDLFKISKPVECPDCGYERKSFRLTSEDNWICESCFKVRIVDKYLDKRVESDA